MSKISVKFDKKGFEQLYKQLDEMERWEAEAGYYGDEKHPVTDLPMSNLAWIQENGATLNNGSEIPSRPFLKQSVDAMSGSGFGQMELTNIIFKDKSPKKELQGMAKKMEDQISITIVYGDFVANRPSTLVSKSGSDPLIDSTYMLDNPRSKVVRKEEE